MNVKINLKMMLILSIIKYIHDNICDYIHVIDNIDYKTIDELKAILVGIKNIRLKEIINELLLIIH